MLIFKIILKRKSDPEIHQNAPKRTKANSFTTFKI